MITWKEMLCNYSESEIPAEHLTNMKKLHEALCIIREHYGKPMVITNCYRSKKHHLDIYKKKGITDTTKIPMKSKHLYGLAVDVADPSGAFHKWCKSNEDLLEHLGVFLESRQGGWQHIQISPFNSYKKGGTIWFNP